MNIKPFKVEQWMNAYETKAMYNLGETCIDSLTVRELLELCGKDPKNYLESLADVRLAYGYIEGSPELLKGIGSLYEIEDVFHVIPTHGAIGANYQAIMTVLEPGDNMVSVMPTYQQHYSIPESVGAEVRTLRLTLENNFLPDIVELSRLVDKKTKMITVNNPNNPTGSLIPEKLMKEIADIAKNVGAYVLSDEVYRGIPESGNYIPSIADIYERGISVGSMSKIFSLAGLRLGWIVTRNTELKNRCLQRRDYDTISCGVIDDMLSSLALGNKTKIFERNRKILLPNRGILDKWVRETPEVYYLRPVAGTTALVFYKKDVPSRDFAARLLEEKGVLVVPGECFEMEGCIRIGYAYDSQKLSAGLELLADFIRGV